MKKTCGNCICYLDDTDENGNVTLERECCTTEVTAIAQAVKNNGGKVIVQVEKVVQAGTLDPKLVKIPGIYVDAVVVAAEENHKQTYGTFYNPAYFGRLFKECYGISFKDYIKNPKPNGYRSYHMIIEVPVFFANKKQNVKVEVQLRTIAMDFWASLEHQLRYKKDFMFTEEMAQELRDCAQLSAQVDLRMDSLRERLAAETNH